RQADEDHFHSASGNLWRSRALDRLRGVNRRRHQEVGAVHGQLLLLSGRRPQPLTAARMKGGVLPTTSSTSPNRRLQEAAMRETTQRGGVVIAPPRRAADSDVGCDGCRGEWPKQDRLGFGV